MLEQVMKLRYKPSIFIRKFYLQTFNIRIHQVVISLHLRLQSGVQYVHSCALKIQESYECFLTFR